MAWRTAIVTNPARLKSRNRQLEVETEVETASLPLEDLAVLVLDTPQLSLSAPLLRDLAEAGVVMYLCDQKHLPCSVLLPLNQHTRYSEILGIQIKASEPFRKRCWQRIVQFKIYNQARCLEARGCMDAAVKLHNFAAKVKSGDTSNVEATAARFYWLELFGDAFRRQEEQPINMALNYGYSVIRSAVARGLVSRGLNTALGVHHKNNLNAFNLADDFVEPFRPIVDRFVADNITDGTVENTPELRANLANLMHAQVELLGESLTLLRAIERMASGFVEAHRSGTVSDLPLPLMVL